MKNKIAVRIKLLITNPQYYFYIYWNRFKLKRYGVKFGKGLKIFSRIYIKKHYSSSLVIGDNLQYSSGGCYNPLCRNIRGSIYMEEGANMIIGHNVGLSSTVLWCSKQIKIGNNVMIGGDTIIMDTDAHSLDYRIRMSRKTHKNGRLLDGVLAKKAPVIIEDNVLIGTRCIILKGVTIGSRSVIAAGSIVTTSIPADCIAGGNPCKIIRFVNDNN